MFEFIIKSFMRPRMLLKCLESIRAKYSQPIHVADDSRHFDPDLYKDIENLHVYRMSYDSGLSMGRNLLLSKINTEYFVLMDSDHILCLPDTVEKMIAISEQTDATIVGGLLWDDGRPAPRNFCGHFEIRGIEPILCLYDRGKSEYKTINNTRYCGCRFTENFFLGRTKDFRENNIEWDAELKLMEHEDFFLRFPTHCRVANTIDVYVRHFPSRETGGIDPQYSKFRYRKEFMEKAKAKYHVSGEFFGRKTIAKPWSEWKFPSLKVMI